MGQIDHEKIVRLLPTYVVIMDCNEEIVYINKTADYIRREDIVGLKFKDFVKEEGYEYYSNLIQDFFKSGKPIHLDIEYNIEWENRQFRAYFTPFEIVDGKVTKALVLNVDNRSFIQTQELAEINEFKFKTIVDNIPDDVLQVDENYVIQFHNKVRTLGEPRRLKLIGRNLLDFVPDEKYKEFLKKNFEKAAATGKPQEYEVMGYDEVNKDRWYRATCNAIIKEDKVLGYILHTFDITTQKLEHLKTKEFNEFLEKMVEERSSELKKANEEIKLLLKETHHRVKNNLQIINSLLNLQSRVSNKEAKDAIELSQNRIQSMALIHEMLYKTDNLSSIKIKDYLETLTRMHVMNFSIGKEIQYKINTSSSIQKVDMDFLIPIGLLINELISNSLKYAFKDAKSPIIEISLEAQDISKNQIYNALLTYKDNGSGFLINENGDEDNGLGTMLIESFVDQLDGVYQILPSEKGVYYEFKFNL
ncbi:MAG: PAS domain-containing protein [Brumimicrobium sp.]|nr:PAS domain-containing protein [Brumimicrobium sp.]